MTEPSIFDEYAELMDVSLSSEYDRMEDLDKEIINDILQIIIETVLQFQQKSTKRGQFDDDFSAFTASVKSESLYYWIQNAECIQTLQNQHIIQNETLEVKKKRKEFSPRQIFVLESEFSKCQSPDPWKCDQIAKILKVSSRRVNSWFKKRRMAEESYNQSSPTSSNITLKLAKQSGNMNVWTVIQQDTQDYNEVIYSPSTSHHFKQSDLENKCKFQNTEFEDDMSTAEFFIGGHTRK
ncbi:uncharacterized protein LOC131668658 isoform X2 [Phymastichus coffea]|uniref:uncharacterized protein LOC131668658 isoform X2 n=1 Tax=Phymastichus coffea TaxID=108790 RepID=UPI00273CD038|nr:uncharacterized protein LOC131668658 isoform X2 [Phymastichus coffea]